MTEEHNKGKEEAVFISLNWVTPQIPSYTSYNTRLTTVYTTIYINGTGIFDRRFDEPNGVPSFISSWCLTHALARSSTIIN